MRLAQQTLRTLGGIVALGVMPGSGFPRQRALPIQPNRLPAFLPNPLETAPSARYIEVSFEVTKYGESRRVEIVGATPDVLDAAKDELASLVKGSRFRPRVTDGELGPTASVVLRYYLNE